ncbi:MAG: hypothetical protein HY851_02490 [candidate division Zixibacteria bacterium]|nr:hypothetical protein [candidate division Zixibacteria bacterium]
MDYGRMIRDSLALAWRHKSLWVFGLFTGWGTTFNTSFGKNDLKSLSGGELGDSPYGMFGQDPSQYMSLLAPFLVGMVIFAIVYILASCIANPAQVDAVNRITRGGTYKFSESFSTGVDFFWRILGMYIVGFVVFLVSMGVIGACVGVAFVITPILGIISLLPAIPLFFFVILALTMIFYLAQRAVVVRNVSIADSLQEGYALFRNHLGKNVVFFLICFGLALGIGMMVGLAMVIIYLPVGALAYSLGAPVWAAFLIAIALALPVSIPVGGYFGTFFSSLFTMFYFGLVEPSGPQAGFVAVAEPTQGT